MSVVDIYNTAQRMIMRLGCKLAWDNQCQVLYLLQDSTPGVVFTPQHNYTLLMVFCMRGHELLFTLFNLDFTSLILFDDLLYVYLEPFKKVCLKNIYIITFASHSM